MEVKVDDLYTKEYLEADKRSIANAIQIFFKDGSQTEKVEVHYPVGHKRRRDEGIPLLVEKFKNNLATKTSPKNCNIIEEICSSQEKLEEMDFNVFSDLFEV